MVYNHYYFIMVSHSSVVSIFKCYGGHSFIIPLNCNLPLFLSPYTCLYLSLSLSLSTCLYLSLSLSVSFSLSTCLNLSLSTCLNLSLSTCLYLSLTTCLYLYLLYLSLSLPVSISLSLYLLVVKLAQGKGCRGRKGNNRGSSSCLKLGFCVILLFCFSIRGASYNWMFC